MPWPEHWRHWPVRSIRRRLLIALLLPLGLVMLATSPWDFQLAVAPSQQAYDEALATEAQALAEQVQWVRGQAQLSLNHQAERFLRANGGDEEFYAVRDARGRFLGGDQNLPPVLAPGAQPQYSDLLLPMSQGEPRPVRMVAVQHSEGGEWVVVQVAETLHKRQAAQARVLVAMVLPNVLVALLSALLLYAAIRLTLAPIEDLARQVAERSPHDLRPIALRQAPSELEQVLGALNRLFLRVLDAARTQQRFHANVAHQLRTPLTGLRTQIELAQMDGAFSLHMPRYERIVAAIDRLTHLIDQLLWLARAEAGASPAVPQTPVDLRAVIEAQASALVDQAIERQIDLGFQLAPTPTVPGVAGLLGELLNNLVDNALRYCPPGSVVTVSCGEQAGRPCLAVEDDGPGIAPDQRALVFARFHRGSTSAAEGSGLGLAIVQEIAELHGAQVSAVTPAQGRGVRFEVHWQAPPST